MWKITVHDRAIIKLDTGQDLVLASAAYWQRFLHPNTKQILQTKKRSLRSDKSVVVSATVRKEQDLTKGLITLVLIG